MVEQLFMLQASNDLVNLVYDEEGGDNGQYFVGCHMGFGCKFCAYEYHSLGSLIRMGG